MRGILSWFIVVGLAASPGMAGAVGPGDAKDSKDTAKAADTSSASKNDSSVKPGSTALENEIQQLRDLLEAQSRQLQLQNAQLKEQQQKMEAMEAELKTVSSTANALTSNTSTPASAVMGVSATGVVATPGGSGQGENEPIAIRFKGVTLTPGGFLAAETVFRNKAIGDDINTNLKNVPLAGASNSQLTEFNATGRQSRLSLLAEGKLENMKLTGYVETDFLSAGVTSNNNESNSYTLRFRQAYGQAALDNGWTFTGGQQWGLVTETRKGLDNRTEASPPVIDPQYTVGFSWARQYGFRVTKNFGDKFWVGVSVENPQTLFGGKVQTQNIIIAAPGDLGGLFNNQANYSFNLTPDFIVKTAWEPGWGHYELFGIARTFRSRIFPCAAASVATPCSNGTTTPSAFGANNQSVTAGGIGGNARFPFFNKKFEVALHADYGDGIGRYGTSTLADVTAHPDGTLEPIRGGQGLLTLEWHPTPTVDLLGYAGIEYDQRTAYVNAAGKGVGFGSPLQPNTGCTTELLPTNQNSPTAPGSCQADTRSTVEGTIQFWHRIYNGPKGRMQWGLQYSYLVRSTWADSLVTPTPGGNPHGIDNMFFTSVRYYLP